MLLLLVVVRRDQPSVGDCIQEVTNIMQRGRQYENSSNNGHVIARDYFIYICVSYDIHAADGRLKVN